MENQVKVNIWTDLYAKEVNSSRALSFNPNDGIVLRMTNHQYDEIFKLLLLGKTIRVENFDLINTTLAQALNNAENENAQVGKVAIFTSEHFTSQNEKFKKLLESNEKTFLTFGLLDYFDDNRMSIKSAPLVFLPIIIELSEDKKYYQIKNINHEVYLNDALIARLNESRRIDISFPIENEFALIEYMTYVATKVRNSHFSVNNGCFISTFNLNPYNYLQDYKNNKDKIAALPLVKSIAYLNSEFFNLNKSASSRLDNNFLSLLNLDNEEYKILKRINLRENLIIKTNSINNKNHLLSNILYNFMLNGKNVLITYNNKKSYGELLDLISADKLNDFVIDLSTSNTDKMSTINKLIHHDRLEFDIKLLDQNKIDETVDSYYLIKNNFKKLINSFRRSNDPMKLSINRAITEFYNLSNIPLISIPVPNAELIDEIKLKEYIETINSFSKSLSDLNCHYIDHPFYGFNRLNLTQDEYREFKQKIIELSSEFSPAAKTFKKLHESFNFPFPETLKEMKCILNIIGLIEDCRKIDTKLFELTETDYSNIINELKLHNEKILTLNSSRSNLISIYGEKIFLIPYLEFKQKVNQKPFNKKVLKPYSQYFMTKAKIDETIATHLCEELDAYYALTEEVENIVKKYEFFKQFYHESIFNLEEINQLLDKIKKFNENCRYLEQNNKQYSYKNLSIFTDETNEQLAKDRKNAQIAFNHLLNLITFIQQYFNNEQSNFLAMPLITMENRIYRAGRDFMAINTYLDFYLSYRKLNKSIPSLADEFLKFNQINQYVLMFTKRYFFDFATSLIQNNPLFKSHNEENFILNIENYSNYNNTRLDMIFALVKNNIRNNLKANQVTLKSIEIPYLNSLKDNDLKALPLRQLLTQSKTSFLSLFPIFIAPSDEVSHLFNNPNYQFDINIVLSDENALTKDIIPSSVRADQTLVFDYKLLQQDDDDDKLIHQSNENFIYSALQSLSNANFVSASYQGNIMSSNRIDISLKKYLCEKLTQQNFIVSTDVIVDGGTIDLLVQIPNSKKSTAIFLDRLSYYSLESAIESFNLTKKKVEELGFAYYRLITSFFFLNEKDELDKLIDFIIKNSSKEKTSKLVKRLRPLVEVLFETYIDPENYFLSITDKKEKSNNELMMEFLRKCAPIAKSEAVTIYGENALSTLASLQANKVIRITNEFIFVNDQEIKFRRYDKKENYTRNFNLISNEEIASGIRLITTQKSLSIDTMIKLILLSLGLKKMNHNQYFRIQNIISDLIEDKEIFVKDDILYSEINK